MKSVFSFVFVSTLTVAIFASAGSAWAQATATVPLTTQFVGNFGEQLTAEALRLRGYTVIQNPQGVNGLDLVVYKGTLPKPSELKIVEVKTTTTGAAPQLTAKTGQMSEEWLAKQLKALENATDDASRQLAKGIRHAAGRNGTLQLLGEVHHVDTLHCQLTIYDDVARMQSTKADPQNIERLLKDIAKKAKSATARANATRLLADLDQIAAAGRTAGSAGTAAGSSATVIDDVAVGASKSVAKTVLKGGAKACVVAGVAVDAGCRGYDSYKTEKAYKNGEVTKQQRVETHVSNATGFAGAMGGAYAGATSGATAGAVIGSVIPGPGTAIGGFFGGVIGGIGGYLVGDYVGTEAGKAAVRACH